MVGLVSSFYTTRYGIPIHKAPEQDALRMTHVFTHLWPFYVDIICYNDYRMLFPLPVRIDEVASAYVYPLRTRSSYVASSAY